MTTDKPGKTSAMSEQFTVSKTLDIPLLSVAVRAALRLRSTERRLRAMLWSRLLTAFGIFTSRILSMVDRHGRQLTRRRMRPYNAAAFGQRAARTYVAICSISLT